MIGGAGRDCEEGFVSVLGESSEDIGCDLFCLDLEEELAGFWLGIGVCLVLDLVLILIGDSLWSSFKRVVFCFSM